ncbi:LIN-59 protein, partial [Aphelenchoides avenae]
MATFFRQKERIPKKHITQMHLAVKKALRTCTASSTSQATVMERFDAAMKTTLQLLSRSLSVPKRRADAIRLHYTQLKRAADFQKTKLPKDAIQTFVDDKRRPALRSKRENVNVVAGEADLSYMDSDNPVGSYDPDKEAAKQASYSNQDEDCVRCVCGIMEDDGTMTQCDRCKFWLHADCINYDNSNSDQELICDFCTKGLDSTPAVDIVLNPQPEIRLQDCHYFKTLANNRGIQVRLNEAVYVERLINDKHKRLLRKFHDRCVKSAATPSKKSEKSRSVTPRKWATPTKSETKTVMKEEQPADEPTDGEEDLLSVANITQKEFHRKDLRIFRVERLFKGPNGERFVFGCYYARPHETFCEPTRQFYKNEVATLQFCAGIICNFRSSGLRSSTRCLWMPSLAGVSSSTRLHGRKGDRSPRNISRRTCSCASIKSARISGASRRSARRTSTLSTRSRTSSTSSPRHWCRNATSRRSAFPRQQSLTRSSKALRRTRLPRLRKR